MLVCPIAISRLLSSFDFFLSPLLPLPLPSTSHVYACILALVVLGASVVLFAYWVDEPTEVFFDSMYVFFTRLVPSI